MGIFDWLFGGKKTTTPEKKETIVKETSETIEKKVKTKSENKEELYYNFRTTKITYNDKLGLVYGDVAVGAKIMYLVVIRVSNKPFETNWMKLTEPKVGEFYTDKNNKYLSWKDVIKLGFEIGSESFYLFDSLDKEVKFSNKDFLEYVKLNYNLNSNNIYLIDDVAPKINPGDKRQFIYENINFEYDYQKVIGLLDDPPYCENIRGNSKDTYEINCQYSKENAEEIIESLFPGKYLVDEDEDLEFIGFSEKK